MSTKFTKMNSQGNDFIIIDLAQEKFTEDQDVIKKICSRDAVGCDQLLLINTTKLNKVTCKIYNNDGSTASQCGNGLRAIMLYLSIKFQITESKIKISGKDYSAQIVDKQNNKVSVDMGRPKFFTDSMDSLFASKPFKGEVVDVGNKHLVIWGNQGEVSNSDLIDSLNIDDLKKLNELQSKYNLTFILDYPGTQDEYDPSFPHQTDVKSPALIRIKVREKGAGWTKSCGSGATAAAALALELWHQSDFFYNADIEKIDAHKQKLDAGYHLMPSPMMIEQEGGVLEVHHDNSGSLKLVGPSEFEYDGVWDG